MSIQALYTAATGMQALETKLDIVSNNLANVNTTAYKSDRCNFEDLFYRHIRLPGVLNNTSGLYTPTGIAVGLGARVQSVQSDFSQGAFQTTNQPLDLAIEGRGFFQVQDAATGQLLYTRDGNFSLNPNGQLVMGSAMDGRLIDPPITIPQDATGIVISPDGTVEIQQFGQNQLQQAGQLQLSSFINPQGLLKLGENLYQQTDASGPPTVGNPGTNGLGLIRQNTLELSNVEPVQQLIDLITTQRAFELNSQTVQAGDQVLQLVANMRRF